MSVVPMKLVTIVGPIDDFDRTVHSHIVNRQFHPERAAVLLQSQEIAGLIAFNPENPYVKVLNAAQQLADELGFELDYHEFNEYDMDAAAVLDDLNHISVLYNELVSEQESLSRLYGDNEQIIKPLEHLLGFNADIRDLVDFTYVKFRFGRMPRETYDSFSLHMEARNDVFFVPTSIERHHVYGMYFTPRAAVQKVDMYYASLHFEQIHLPKRVEGTPNEAIAALRAANIEITKRLDFIEKRLKSLKEENRVKFLTDYSYARYMSDAHSFRAYAARSVESFFIIGWVPVNELKAFVKPIDDEPMINCVVEDPPADNKPRPPTKLKNNVFSKAFQPFVEMYGLPAYNEIDPTLLISITYTILFGIMFGDVGQGLLLIILGIVLYRWKGMWLGRIISYAGVAAVITGFVYGNVFGFEHLLPGFKVLESSANTNAILLFAVGIGILLIALAMILNIANGIKQRNLEKALFSHNGLAGLVFYVSVVVAAALLIIYGVNILKPAFIVPLMVLPLIIIFLRRPLEKLIRRDPDWKPESIVNFIIENFFELFEVLLSYVTNTISFLRVGAFAISHPGMMLVVFLLAGSQENPSIPVVVIGNLVVMGIEGLLAGIQVLRLEFYEIFGRFYSGEGQPFTPVAVDYKTRNTSV